MDDAASATAAAAGWPGQQLTLREVLKVRSASAPLERSTSCESVAAIIDAHVRDHVQQHVDRGSRHQWYAVVGPSAGEPWPRTRGCGRRRAEDDECCDAGGMRCYTTVRAYDALHAKYSVVVDFTADANVALSPESSEEIRQCLYAYPITSYLGDLMAMGADIYTCVDVFRTSSLEPFMIVPYDNMEISDVSDAPTDTW